jgi:8-oxo-dGTP pyrophosphatase MutT (NUDIX family)
MVNNFIITKRKDLKITASVGIVSPVSNLSVYYLIKNKRGWDIPGGRIEKNEEPNKTFEREFKEETGFTLKSIVYIATLESKLIPGTGINVYYGICCKEKFEPSEEVSHIKLLSRKEAVKYYFGDKNILASLFDLCEKIRKS